MYKMNAKFVASEIYSQLGGREFIAMTGSKQFRYGEDDNSNPFLQFILDQNEFNIHKYSKVRIVLMPSDTYKLSFYQEDDSKHKEVHNVENIYCDQLKDIFELETNLLVTFNQRRSSSVKVKGGIFGELVRG